MGFKSAKVQETPTLVRFRGESLDFNESGLEKNRSYELTEI
jgi:hypothetical protein